MFDPQLALVIACIGGATAYLARKSWRTWSPSSKGCTGCGCASKPATKTSAPLISTDDLTVRLRSRREQE